MDTIRMDTYPSVMPVTVMATGDHAAGSGAPPSTGEGDPWPLPVLSPPRAGKRRWKRPLANVHSPRDNYVYRASFTRPNRP